MLLYGLKTDLEQNKGNLKKTLMCQFHIPQNTSVKGLLYRKVYRE